MNQRPAQVLLLSILLTATLAASTIAVSTVISNSTSQSQSTNNFIAASLQADSGIERGLAVVKLGRKSSKINDTVSAITYDQTTPLLNVTGTSTGSTISNVLLRANESITFDILSYDESGQLQSNLAENSNLLWIQGTGTGRLDLSWIGLDTSALPKFTGRSILANASVINGITKNLFDNVIDATGTSTSVQITGTVGFRVRIKALDQDVKINDVNTGITESLPGGQGLPSRINITSTAQVGATQSQKQANVLWQLSSSPVFNYVLFTEGNITTN